MQQQSAHARLSRKVSEQESSNGFVSALLHSLSDRHRERGNSKHESNGRDDSSSLRLSFSLVTKLLFVCSRVKGLREEGRQGLVEAARSSPDLERCRARGATFRGISTPATHSPSPPSNYSHCTSSLIIIHDSQCRESIVT